MSKKKNFISKSIISIVLLLCMVAGFIPNVFAAQSNEYVDPAEIWLSSNNRTNELDVNATITNETQYCVVCNKNTAVITYRVPEYTKTGETALNRSIRFSDGTMLDGRGKGNLDDGTPGVDAYYTGYHWCKSVCQTCGTINSVDGSDSYAFNNNVYILYSCDHNFYLEFDSSTYEPYSKDSHLTTLKRGEYCKFCKGTFARATQGLEEHNFTEHIDAQIGNNRFYIAETCDTCGYETSEYVTAKSVVASYYGVEDGEAHTLTINDLSDKGVKTSIRYGASADSCTKTSAPNYTQAGYYTVFYEIDYSYAGEVMTENGVSYVHLVADNEEENKNGTVIILPQAHEHEFHYLETVKPSCEEFGYERFQCGGCGQLEKRNYMPAMGHSYDEIVIREATCKEGGLVLTICSDCGDFYQTTTLVGEHKYNYVKHNATCQSMGYTEHTCKECGDNYITNLTLIVSHAYERVTKEPTCTERGYTTSTCTMCGLNNVSDYTEPSGHEWDEGQTVTASTCEGEGVTMFDCNNCSEKMIKATSPNGHTPGEKATCSAPQLCRDCGSVLESATGHSYAAEVTEPTCTAMGYTTYTCDSCGDSYIGDYTDRAEHEYSKAVTEPTCTAHGFTTYSCTSCEDEYVSDYVSAMPHAYEANVTAPTCTGLGYTTYFCECGETYKADYTTPIGHTASEWIVDVPATIEGAGSKRIACTVCGETMQTAEIARLLDTDRTDEDGNVTVGNYSIILTDKDGIPVFDSEISIDVNDNVTIRLPGGRLLDFADQTTITAFLSETQEPATDLRIFIYDASNNAATGQTNENGQLKVPNDKSSTGDENGTIGTENGEGKETYVVSVTDKTNLVIPDCEVYIGESNNVVVDLPDGIKPTKENPVIVTITDQDGNAQAGVTVIALGDADFIEKGETDIYGKITLPIASDGYTDEDGKVNVDELNVIVNDERGEIPGAYVQHNEDGSITVTLPDEKIISYANRITVTVLDSVGTAVKNKSVTVKDIAEESYTALTDENGKMVVPPVNTDRTDSEGKAAVNGYNVLLTDESKPIENAYIEMVDGKINVTLPEGTDIDVDNRITATIADGENRPVKDMRVTFKDSTEKSETNLTDENGKATVPPVNTDYTDVNGYSEVDGYIVTVTNETGKIEKAFVAHNAEVKNEDATVKTEENITVLLPEGTVFDYKNRITVTVQSKVDKMVIKGMHVIITEAPVKEEDEIEAPASKSLNGITDANGKAVFPPLSEDVTDNEGNSGVEETKPDTDEKTEYKVLVNDTQGLIGDALVKIEDGKVMVTLPEGKTLSTSNQTTVTVTDNKDKAVKGVSVTIKDKITSKAGKTNTSGKVTLPVKSSGGGSSYSGGGGGGGGSFLSTSVQVVDKNGKTISVTRSITTTDASLTLPADANLLEDDNYYTITVTYGGKAKADYPVVLKDKKGNEVKGTTDDSGVIILPGKEHKAYIYGYNDGTFKADDAMTRSEAAAIFARLIAEEKDETVTGKATFSDVDAKNWAYHYIGYLEKYDIIKGYADGTFGPDAPVTRAEFVTMAVRYYALFNDVKKGDYTVNYKDLAKSYWAYADIAYAKHIGWLNGYADGTFKGDNHITRAEVVTVTNHATGRTPDEDYINKNVSTLNKFTDFKNNSHWGYYDIMEAANTHRGVLNKDAENWVK